MLFCLEERLTDGAGPESPQRRRLLRGLGALAAVASVRPLVPLFPVEGEGRTTVFTPAVLTSDIAARYLAGGEWMGERELGRFHGRFFRTRVDDTEYHVLLSQEVYDHFAARVGNYQQDLFPPRSYDASISQAVRNYLNQPNPWGEVWTKVLEATSNRVDPDSLVLFTFNQSGQPRVIVLRDDQADWQERQEHTIPRQSRASVYGLGENGELISSSSSSIFFPDAMSGAHNYGYRLHLRYHDVFEQIVATDDYQVLYYWQEGGQNQGFGNGWTRIFPHERLSGRYELLTPEQRIRTAMRDLAEITGYNETGLWTQENPTVVDYTDTQGQKRHKELNVYSVHASQNPNSPVVYEVLEDPATGEMMLTVRKSNDDEIKGLNGQQAALVRQAWAYLLAADPEIMVKFWRVNKNIAVAIKPSLPDNQASTGWLVNGQCGLTVINPIIFFDPLGKLALDLLQEGYESYGAQFGWGEGWIYTTTPPDCLDNNLVRDAFLRDRAWMEVALQ